MGDAAEVRSLGRKTNKHKFAGRISIVGGKKSFPFLPDRAETKAKNLPFAGCVLGDRFCHNKSYAIEIRRK